MEIYLARLDVDRKYVKNLKDNSFIDCYKLHTCEGHEMERLEMEKNYLSRTYKYLQKNLIFIVYAE